MAKVLIAPRRYVQGRDVLKEAGSLIGALGKKAMVLWDARVKGVVGEVLLASLKDAKIEVVDVDLPARASIGDLVRFSFRLQSTAAAVQPLLIDYVVHFVKLESCSSTPRTSCDSP